MVENSTAVDAGNGVAASQASAGTKSKFVKKKPGKSSILGAIILLAVLALAGGGYFFLDQLREKQEGLGGAVDKGDKRFQETSQQMTALQKQLAALQAQLGAVQTKTATQENEQERKLSEFSDHHGGKLESVEQKFDQAIKQLQRQVGKTRGDWMVADAEYLLSVANQRLNLVGDSKTAIEALEAADQRLRESGDAGAFKIREAIAKDINKLKAIKEPDIVGLYSNLRLLVKQAERLPLFLPHAGKVAPGRIQEEPDTKGQEPPKDIDSFVDSALEDLKGLVKVRRTERPIGAVLTSEEAAIIREELQLKLELAQLALVERNQKIFSMTLQDVEEWLRENFDTGNKTVGVYISDVNKLGKVALELDYPDISLSLKMLRDLTKFRIDSEKAVQKNEG